MTLPTITAPAGTPVFLASGHESEEASQYGQVRFVTGHARARRLRTGVERVVSVEWFLEAAQLADVEDWFEDALQAGALEFAAHVANIGPGLLWYRARWIEFAVELMHLGRGKVTGKLLLRGEGEALPPATGVLGIGFDVALVDVQSEIAVDRPLGIGFDVALLEDITPEEFGSDVDVSSDEAASDDEFSDSEAAASDDATSDDAFSDDLASDAAT